MDGDKNVIEGFMGFGITIDFRPRLDGQNFLARASTRYSVALFATPGVAVEVSVVSKKRQATISCTESTYV